MTENGKKQGLVGIQVDTCMDLPDTDKSNKETEKTIACICKMIQNEKKTGPKKSFFLKK